MHAMDGVTPKKRVQQRKLSIATSRDKQTLKNASLEQTFASIDEEVKTKQQLCFSN